MKKYKNEAQNLKTQMVVREKERKSYSLKEGGFGYCGIKPYRSLL